MLPDLLPESIDQDGPISYEITELGWLPDEPIDLWPVGPENVGFRC